MNIQLKEADRLIRLYHDHANDLLSKLSESEFYNRHSKWDTETFLSLRGLLFSLVTGESDFDDFYDRFDAPTLAKGDKPIAWGPRFLPDLIQDEIMSDDSIVDRVKKIKKLYDKCIKLEKNFKPKKNKNA